MNVLILYKSYHRRNTEKVARAMAEVMDAKIKRVEDARIEDLACCDLIGFGSGIYGGKPHRSLFQLVDKIPPSDKKAFIFSTSGEPKDEYHRLLREKLSGKGFRIVGEFQSPGESGLFGWTFTNRGHPDETDLQNARNFAKKLIAV